MASVMDVRVPDIGDFKDVPVIEVLVSVGQAVNQESGLIVLESDKSTVEVPAPERGVVRELLVAIGDRVSEGALLLRLETEAQPEAGAAAPPSDSGRPAVDVRQVGAPPTPAIAPSTEPPALRSPASAADAVLVRASPALRKLARQLGVDLRQVRATGERGRVQREDIEGFVKVELQRAAAIPAGSHGASGLALAPWPTVDFAKFGPVEREPLSRIQKISGANLARNWAVIPHVTNFDEADVTDLETFRVQLNQERGPHEARITMLAFLIKAAVDALRVFPRFNASLDGDEIVYKRYFHIGFAADTPRGLVVPVIRDADGKGLLQIAAEVAELAALARDNKLQPAQMQGGCFSVSSLGGVGGDGFTPIINAPEVAILGAARARQVPRWDGAQFRPRLALPLQLSWDHRVVDGVAAARFLRHICAALADLRRALL